MNAPLIIGSGLVCLDAVLDPEGGEPFLHAGGTSLNVLCHLHRQGWRTRQLGTLGRDAAARDLLNDLQIIGLPAGHIVQRDDIETPIYVERLGPDGHRFLRKCPYCGHAFATYRSPDAETASRWLASLPGDVDFVMLERADAFSCQLAHAATQQGARIYLELNRVDDPQAFHQLVAMTDVFKYSQDRCGHFEPLADRERAPLEIETQGREGLRFRLANRTETTDWQFIAAPPCASFVDGAGAGDAFSAAFLQGWAQHNREWLRHCNAQALHPLLQQAQAAAAQNCRYLSPRGGMYSPAQRQRGGFCCTETASMRQ